MPSLWKRLRFLRRAQLEQEMAEEVRFHLEARVSDLTRRGLDRGEARRQARLEFGSVEAAKEECRHALGGQWGDFLRRDFTFAFRRLRANPGFCGVAILSLALGIGANTLVFSALNTLIFRPLPVDRPDELVYFNTGRNGNGAAMSYPDYIDFRGRNNALSGIMAYRVTTASFGTEKAVERLWGNLVTGNYFEVLGVPALHGRVLNRGDDRERGGHPVVVLSYSNWTRRFGGDPAVIGGKVKVNGLDFTVVGVAPPSFQGTESFLIPEFWVPMAMQAQVEPANPWLDRRDAPYCHVIGRLKRGVTIESAQSAISEAGRQISREYLGTDDGKPIRLAPPGFLGSRMFRPLLQLTLSLGAVTGLVLLIACMNIAGLMLARCAERRQEIMIQLALGAGRMELARQLIAESFLLCAAGGVAACLFMLWLSSAVTGWRLVTDVPVVLQLPTDYRVLAFTALLCAVTSIGLGLLPAFQASRTELTPGLKQSAEAGRRRWFALRDVMLAGQIAMSVLLLCGCVLVVGSMRRSLEADLGFEAQGLVTGSFDLAMQGYDPAKGRQLQIAVLEKLQELPGIESAALVNALPLSFHYTGTAVIVEGQPTLRPEDVARPYAYQVTSGYFRTMRTRLLEGREFSRFDIEGAKPVALVNRAFVQQVLKGEPAAGKRIRFGGATEWREIVGVVQNSKYRSITEDPAPAVYTPLPQTYSANTVILARSARPPGGAFAAIQQMIRGMDPYLALFQTGSMVDYVKVAMAPSKAAGRALSAFGLLALVLAATGVYGVTAFAVARRTREIGIRIAIGASRANTLRLVLTKSMAILAAGCAMGVLAFLFVSKYLSMLFPEVEAPVAMAAGIAIMATAAAIGSLAPALRAVRLDPAAALRHE